MNSILKKIICVAGIIAASVGSFGCGVLYFKDYREDPVLIEEVKNMGNNIAKILEKGDRTSFKNAILHSVSAQSDYKKGEDYTFEMFSGPIQEVINDVFRMERRYSSVEGQSYKTIHATYQIITDKENYLLRISYYTEHDYESYIGKIVKIKLISYPEERAGCFSDMGLRYGVYYPGWVDDIREKLDKNK